MCFTFEKRSQILENRNFLLNRLETIRFLPRSTLEAKNLAEAIFLVFSYMGIILITLLTFIIKLRE